LVLYLLLGDPRCPRHYRSQCVGFCRQLGRSIIQLICKAFETVVVFPGHPARETTGAPGQVSFGPCLRVQVDGMRHLLLPL
jgi:hypothetical protein